jgi:linearmycin/streptolysin S transport system permease protein
MNASIDPRRAFEIARVSMLRTFRDRMGLFFIVALPMILIIVLGITYGGMGAARVGVADADGSPLSQALVADLQASSTRLDVRPYATAAELRDAVQRGFVEAGLTIPAGYASAVGAGEQVSVEFIAQPQSYGSVVRTAVQQAVGREASVVAAARIAASTTGVTFEAALAAARSGQTDAVGMAVPVESVTEATVNPNGFAVGAQSQVILFMFLTSMTGAAVLVSTRQLGISRRELSTPTSAATIIAGETLGRLTFALFQGGFIVLATAILFGVDWIDAPATTAIIVAFALVASAAAMLVATVVSNEHQVSAVGPALGMIFGLLGGTMVPIEVFPSVMRTLSHVTPHAWAIDAFHRLLLDGGGLTDVLPEVGVLLGFAAVILALAVVRFRRSLAG